MGATTIAALYLMFAKQCGLPEGAAVTDLRIGDVPVEKIDGAEKLLGGG